MAAFHEPSIARAPQAPAAYRLLRGERVIFIGMALDLRASLPSTTTAGKANARAGRAPSTTS